MGGQGRRRREKNYRAAHGGPTRLPPPPDPSQVDALPSKLRKLISFTSTLQDSNKVSKDENRKIKVDADADKGFPEKKRKLETTGIEDGDADSVEEMAQNGKNEKGKKKRKRKEVKDLRFEAEIGNLATRSKRKERKKKYLEEKKKKHKKAKTEEEPDFPGREKIKFGDVVEGPPKLLAVPKSMKIDASKERLRLQAIESYRNRKGWTSRPGLQLPPVIT
ncbi:protein PXR1 isoform X2 [Mangifera indica]|uniref:protein PXR1 isoform X2 n=1 Tax=Mangifera indica TaxID=29780 RepID=UPI001CFA290D|nr:protein PXR1 isoform X2 [Mangifera indica]